MIFALVYWIRAPHGSFSFRHNMPIAFNLFLVLLLSLLYVITFFDWFGKLNGGDTSVHNVDIATLQVTDPSSYVRFIALMAVTAAEGVVLLFSFFQTLVSFGHPELSVVKYKTTAKKAATPAATT